MSNKFLISAIILSLISSNVIAGTGHGYKILSHKQEVSTGSKGWFVEKSINNPSSNPTYASTYAQPYNAEGYIDENITLKADHSFSISNETNLNQSYTYTYELNCDGQYFHSQDVISLVPGGNYQGSGTSYLETYHNNPGLFAINASTRVEGESFSEHTGVGELRVNG